MENSHKIYKHQLYKTQYDSDNEEIARLSSETSDLYRKVQ